MSSADLDQLYESWEAASNPRDTPSRMAHIKAARLLTASREPEVWRWLADALLDERRKWFVADFFRKYPVPKRLFDDMIRAGVYEEDPSFNRDFIEPCLLSYGRERVCDALLIYLQSGTDVEKAGAASALYWTRYRTAPVKIQKQICNQFLWAFVNNPDLQVRRTIIPQLVLTPWAYPRHLRPLVKQAITIARSHADEYIRHRVEVQLGNPGGGLMPIPKRGQPPANAGVGSLPEHDGGGFIR